MRKPEHQDINNLAPLLSAHGWQSLNSSQAALVLRTESMRLGTFLKKYEAKGAGLTAL